MIIAVIVCTIILIAVLRIVLLNQHVFNEQVEDIKKIIKKIEDKNEIL